MSGWKSRPRLWQWRTHHAQTRARKQAATGEGSAETMASGYRPKALHATGNCRCVPAFAIVGGLRAWQLEKQRGGFMRPCAVPSVLLRRQFFRLALVPHELQRALGFFVR